MYIPLLYITTLLPLALTIPTSPNLITRQPNPNTLSQNDINTLELALFLEHLEYNLYLGGYENFTEEQYVQYGFPAGFRDGVGITAQQESVHVGALSDVLVGANVVPVPNCTYNFGYGNPKVSESTSS